MARLSVVLSWYVGFLSQWPVVVMLLISVVSVLLSAFALFAVELPDFSDPLEGFETRGTEISARLMTWENLQENIGPGKLFYRFPPREVFLREQQPHTVRSKRDSDGLRRVSRKAKKNNRQNKSRNSFSKGQQQQFQDEASQFRFCQQTVEEGAFPGNQFAKLVFRIRFGDVNALKFLCHYERLLYKQLRSQFDFRVRQTCVAAPLPPKSSTFSRPICCQAWHLANVAAFLSKRSTCADLTFSDNVEFWDTVRICLPFRELLLKCEKEQQKQSVTSHFSSQMRNGCLRELGVPGSCGKAEIFHVFFYLLEAGSWSATTKNDTPAVLPGMEQQENMMGPSIYSMMILPFVKSPHLVEAEMLKDLVRLLTVELPEMVQNSVDSRFSYDYHFFFNATQQRSSSSPRNTVMESIGALQGLDFGFRTTIFQLYLLEDSVYCILAAIFVFLLLWFYTGSFFYTGFAMLGILLALGVAYFLYVFVFQIAFFPFMNLLTFVLLFGVGVDDACIFHSMFENAANKDTLGIRLEAALSHAGLSMFVTSLTTAAALFSNYFSHVIALRCFGVFAGTAILLNYVFAITWLPTTKCFLHRTSGFFKDLRSKLVSTNHEQKPGILKSRIKTLKAYITNGFLCRVNSGMFIDALNWIVVRGHLFWIFAIGCIGLLSIFTVFYYPGIRLPSSDYFMLLKETHPIELYEKDLKRRFLFAVEAETFPMPIQVLWGVKPIDNGHVMNPLDRGWLVLDSCFQLSDSLILHWLRNFCTAVSRQNFTHYGNEPMLPHCFVHDFIQWMERPCLNPIGQSMEPCCRSSQFPYSSQVVEQCIHKAASGFSPNGEENIIGLPLSGPLFLGNSTSVRGMAVSFLSKERFSYSFMDMKRFYTDVNDWVSKTLSEGPLPVRNGFFVSALNFFDVQRALVDDTLMAILVTGLIALVVVFVITLNAVITLLAVLSICFVISTTVAVLILLSWELNILESTIVVLAVGLSFDYSLHYAVMYKLSPEQLRTRESRVHFILQQSAIPVSISAASTFLAGTPMLLSSTVAYFRTGLFMMLLTSISWSFSSLFLTSLLYCFGPAGESNCQKKSFKLCSLSNQSTEKQKLTETLLLTEQNCSLTKS